MPLFNRFQQFLSDQALFHQGERILLSVSGGVDSVVMTHLACRAGLDIALAHCNFQLRGEESNRDEEFVRQLALERQLPFFSKAFDTRKEAEAQGVSIQMAARDLRYDWLEELRRKEGFDRIATAHHLDDSIETVLYHFAKGTGLRGLHGIPLQREALVRPLLFAHKGELLEYAQEEGLSFREDASNAETAYARNKIRHQVLPVLRAINPAFDQTAAANLQRFKEAEYLFDWALAHLFREVCRQEDDRLLIDIDSLLRHYPAAATLLFEWLRPMGFQPSQIPQILDSIGRQPGALFFSGSHQLLIDRNSLIIQARGIDSQEKVYYIAEQIETIYLPEGALHLAWKEGTPIHFPSNAFQAILDSDKLELPLRLRHWRPGDFFYPLGMNGRRKKLQDFFSDQKIPRLDKDRVWLLVTEGEEIAWVLGHRIDERFKVSSQTTRYLNLHFTPIK